MNKKEKEYLNQVTQTYTRAYNTIYDQYKDLSHVIFTGILRLGDVKTKLENIESKSLAKKDEIRESLYNETVSRFNNLKSKHILSINFILPNNEIFLKMRNPKSFGDKFSQKRYLIEDINKNKKSLDSFEIGKCGAGYRFVYPIFKDNKYLGAMSIVFSEQAITSSIMKQYYVLSNFIFKSDNFDKEFLKNSKLYKKAHHEGYLHNVQVLKELKKISRKDISQIKPSQETSIKIYKEASKAKINSMFLDDIDLIVTTIPVIHKLTNTQEAFVAIISKGHKLSSLNKNYMVIFYLLVVLYITVLLVVYQQYIKNLIEKENLRKIIQKDKQLLEQSKLAQMGEMIANIAHQWRQPLSTISTVASGVKLNQEFGILNEKEIPEHMDLIVNNVKHLSETIDTFRDFIKEGKEKKEIVLQERIEESLRIVNASIDNAHIKLINSIRDMEDIKIWIIAEELSQVIINILNNAKDAIIQRNREDRWIKISLDKKEETVSILIEDSAGGIDENVIEHIFDPYFTTKEEFHGTGLGLYMSKTIVEKHFEGEIKVRNSKSGAIFELVLPLK